MSLLVLFHPMDPRGAKLGGIETHVRLVLARHPAATRLLFVGTDEIGDRALGRVADLDYEGRSIRFLPVARVDPAATNMAARRVTQSVTLRFALGALRHIGAIRAALGGERASCEIERFEFALLPKLLGRPFVLMVHNEGTAADKMDSLLKRYWRLHQFNERVALTLADHVFAVNASIATRINGLSRALGAKTSVMSVSVDGERFRPSGFVADEDAFHVCFAGRLDDFKDPPLMFASLARLGDRLAYEPIGRFRRLVFDYLGASDPARFPEFAAIAGRTVRHGICQPRDVAAIMRGAHAGIITSFFEGMPCYLLEMLASGRPVAAISLPQFAPLILPGVSGALVARHASADASAEAVAGALAEIAAAIDGGMLDPGAIAALARPYSVASQMGRLFECHDALARRGSRAPAVQPSRSASAR